MAGMFDPLHRRKTKTLDAEAQRTQRGAEKRKTRPCAEIVKSR